MDNENALKLLKLASDNSLKFFVSPITVSTSFYLTRKDSNAIAKITSRLNIINVLPMDGKDVQFSLTSNIPDKKDGMQISCAERGLCDIIITRDSKHFVNSPVPSMSPSEFLSRLFEHNG